MSPLGLQARWRVWPDLTAKPAERCSDKFRTGAPAARGFTAKASRVSSKQGDERPSPEARGLYSENSIFPRSQCYSKSDPQCDPVKSVTGHDGISPEIGGEHKKSALATWLVILCLRAWTLCIFSISFSLVTYFSHVLQNIHEETYWKCGVFFVFFF